MKTAARSRGVLVGAATAAAMILASWPAAALSAEDEETSLLCKLEMEVQFQNAISLQPSSGWIRTQTPGDVWCSGRWRGEPADGLAAEIRYDGYTREATCAHAVIGGKISVYGASINQPVTVTFETRRLGSLGFSSGQTDDGRLAYVASVTLTRREGEDCISRPLTGGRVEGSVLLYGT